MAKIIQQTVEVSVCAKDSFSPVKIVQVIELAPNEAQVPAELERWSLDHCTKLALEYANRIKKVVAPELPEITPQQVHVSQTPVQQQNFVQQPAYNGYGSNEIETLLSTPVPESLFGKTKPAKFAQFGFTLRACNQKEITYIAYNCRKASDILRANAQRLLQLGYQG